MQELVVSLGLTVLGNTITTATMVAVLHSTKVEWLTPFVILLINYPDQLVVSLSGSIISGMLPYNVTPCSQTVYTVKYISIVLSQKVRDDNLYV